MEGGKFSEEVIDKTQTFYMSVIVCKLLVNLQNSNSENVSYGII
jgi:hypothetical protein